MTVPQPWFYFVSGLLYPGALGVALTWFAQAVSTYLTGGSNRPSAWSMFFVLWFLTYHSFLFVRLMADTNAENYEGHRLISDLLDCVVLFAVFAILGFQPDTPPQSLGFGSLFVAAGCVPVSAFIAHYDKLKRLEPFRIVLMLLALIFAVGGAIANFCGVTYLDVLNRWLLVALWVLLAMYLLALYGRGADGDKPVRQEAIH